MGVLQKQLVCYEVACVLMLLLMVLQMGRSFLAHPSAMGLACGAGSQSNGIPWRSASRENFGSAVVSIHPTRIDALSGGCGIPGGAVPGEMVQMPLQLRYISTPITAPRPVPQYAAAGSCIWGGSN